MTRSTPWKDDENKALVALYFVMLDKALSGESYSKAEMIREERGEECKANPGGHLGKALSGRSRGSIEFKLMNASAAHADLMKAPPGSTVHTMHSFGYRALPNYQAGLKQVMLDTLTIREAFAPGSDWLTMQTAG